MVLPFEVKHDTGAEMQMQPLRNVFGSPPAIAPSSVSHQSPDTMVAPSGSSFDQVRETVCSSRLG